MGWVVKGFVPLDLPPREQSQQKRRKRQKQNLSYGHGKNGIRGQIVAMGYSALRNYPPPLAQYLEATAQVEIYALLTC